MDMPPVILAIGAGISVLATSTAAIAIGAAAVSVGIPLIEHAIVGTPRISTTPDFSQDARNQTVTARQAISPWRVIYGRAQVGGTMTFIDTGGGANEFLYLVLTLAGHQVQSIDTMYFDGVAVPLDGSGNATGTFAGFVHAEFNLGTAGQAAFPGLVAADGARWTSAHKQSGRAGVFVQLKFSADLFPNGVPNISFDVHGKPLFDPRSSLTAYSENAALAIRDFLTNATYGMGATAAEIDDSSFISAANNCDESVTLRTGGSENRYACNGTFLTSAKPSDTLTQLLTSMAGYVVYTAGKWSCYAGVYRPPTVTLTDDDLRAPIQITTRRSKRDLCNGVKGIFVSPGNKWQPSDFPAFPPATSTSASYLTEDAGERLWRDVEYPFTISSPTAQRLAKIELERNRRQLVATWPCRLSAYQLQVPDTVMVTRARFGWASKVFEVQNAKLDFTEDSEHVPLIGVDLVLGETDAGVYTWVPANDEQPDPVSPTTNMPTPLIVQPPTAMALATVTTARADGLASTYLQVTWTVPADQFVTAGGHVYVEYRLNGTTPWLVADIVDGSTNKVLIDGLNEGSAYDVRIFSRNTALATSARVEQDAFVLGANTAYFTGGVIGRSFGKNLLGNPSFEFNVSGTPIGTALAAGRPCTDEWVADHFSAFQTVQIESGGNSRSGSNCLLISSPAPGVTLPASSGPFDAVILTAVKIPCSVGDIVRISGWIRQDNSAPPPAGITIATRIGCVIFDHLSTQIGLINADAIQTPNLGYLFLQASLVIPPLLSGLVPSFMRFICSGVVTNTNAFPVSTGGNLYGNIRFDDLKLVLQNTAFDVTPINTAATPQGGNPLSATGPATATTAVINVASSTWQFGDGTITYPSGSITNLNASTLYYVFGDDPTYSGSLTNGYQATTDNSLVTAANGRIFFGRITTPSVANTTANHGRGGGNGSCFSGNTILSGLGRFDRLQVGDILNTKAGPRRVANVLIHDYEGLMHDMGAGELVTPGHHLWLYGQWTPAMDIFEATVEFNGKVYNCEMEGETNDEHNYLLANGWFAHNSIKEVLPDGQ